jgi:hypothetical protein
MSILRAFITLLLLDPGLVRAEPLALPASAPQSLTLPAPALHPLTCGPHQLAGTPLCLKLALEADPAYHAAVRRRNGGIVLTSVLGGAGAVMLVVAGLWTWGSWLGEFTHDGRSPDYETPRYLAIVGAATIGAGLLVGLPVMISGIREARAIRRGHLQPVLSLGPERAVVGASLRF